MPVDKCADYLLTNKEPFDYATALANGWLIATGIIEGACRHLVKDRMAFHNRQECPRNYLSAPQNNDARMAA